MIFIPDAATFTAYGTGLAAFFTGFATGITWLVRSVRRKAFATAKSDHAAIQDDIKKAVTDDRKKQAGAFEALQAACEAYKELAGVRGTQLTDLQGQFNKLIEDFKKLKKENAALKQANTDMTVELHDLNNRLKTLENLAQALPHQ